MAKVEKRKPRLLWANPFCMLDTSSGASMSVREMLHQLVQRGYEVKVVGATVFDSDEGVKRFGSHWQRLKEMKGKIVNVKDGPLVHQLVKTRSTKRAILKSDEADTFLVTYLRELHQFKPDVVWFYGGGSLDLLVPYEARIRGIPSAAYLCNGNYKATSWCKDVDVIITDTQATADMYSQGQGFFPVPVGKFINPSKFVADKNTRERILFVNPSYSKGAGIMALIAMILEKRRPDIVFEVVESRGSWSEVLRQVSKATGNPRTELSNVVVTPNTDDMKPIYGRARLLMAPSLWYESGARVIAESLLNGIPCVVTNKGGSPELMGDAGFLLELPDECYKIPFTKIPKPAVLEKLLDYIISIYDDQEMYSKYVERAYEVGNRLHAIDNSTNRLLETLKPLIDQRAGDKDHGDLIKNHHKHKLSFDSIKYQAAEKNKLQETKPL